MRMTMIAVGLTLAVGCGSKKSDSGGNTSGTSADLPAPVPAPPPPPPPPPRPSAQPQAPLEKLALPEDPKRAEKVALGHALFFDARLSGSKDRSCYSCHQNEDGNGGHDPIAIGSGNKPLTRHSPVLWNIAYAKAFYWDGRAKTLEANVKAAWGGANMAAAPAGAKPDEMTAPLDKKAAELAKVPGYKKLFAAAYGKEPIKGDHVVGAMSEYIRTMVCADTAYDKFVAGAKDALDEQQQRGMDVFFGKGACITCHAAPHFSNAMVVDGGFYANAGIGTKDVPEDKVDVGRFKVSNQPTDWAAFKVPTLRNIAKSAPYFHDGSVATLEDAVRVMASGGIANKAKSPLLEDKKLTAAELADLVAFLRGLDCGTLEVPAKQP
jgi:cytochrome c peroxidase